MKDPARPQWHAMAVGPSKSCGFLPDLNSLPHLILMWAYAGTGHA